MNTGFPMTIADRVKQLRKDHGLTQEDLAAKAGLGVATVQRVERGDHPSAATIAGIASAFALSPTDLTSTSKTESPEPGVGSYLPLAEITSGKRLMDSILASSAIDFDYMEIEDETTADSLARFYIFCLPRQDSKMPSSLSDRIQLDMEAAKFLKELKARDLTVAGGEYERTAHEVDDDDGCGMAILFAKWDEMCLVLRIGTGGVIVHRADVEARMDKWTTTNDPRIVRPKTDRINRSSETQDDIPF